MRREIPIGRRNGGLDSPVGGLGGLRASWKSKSDQCLGLLNELENRVMGVCKRDGLVEFKKISGREEWVRGLYEGVGRE